MKPHLLLLPLLLLLSGCRAAPAPRPLSRTLPALDTVVTITLHVYPDDGADVLDAACAELMRLESLLSRTLPDSDVARLNAAAGVRVTVAPETAEVLTRALWWAEQSGGAFDPTVGALSALWDFHGDAHENHTLPDPALLAQALKAVGWRGLHVEGDAAWLDDPAAAVDLGGIAKGYIADRLAVLLRARGVRAALLDLGGNIYALGAKPSAGGGVGDWQIGIRDPADPAQTARTVAARDMSVVTSGVYERGFTLDGARYHHLLDPATGYPVQNGLLSVTVIAQSSADADALSTACFVLGRERGEALARAAGAEVVMIEDRG